MQDLDTVAEQYRDAPGNDLYDAIEGSRSFIECRYGYYRGVFATSHRGGLQPDEADKSAVARKVAAEKVRKQRIADVMTGGGA